MIELIPDLHVGASAVVQKKVEIANTASEMGLDSLDTLLATPTYVDLMIRASIKVLKPNFPYSGGFITVGTSMSFNHLAPTSLGQNVSVRATLTAIHGNHFSFKIEAFDEIGIIGTGTHDRVMVSRDGLMEKVRQRTTVLNNMR